MCYCDTCFADRGDAKWVSKKPTPEEAWLFHVSRAMHIAGRCSGCGECTRACPMEINVGKLTYLMNKKVEELFDFKAGTDMDADPVLGSFNPDDPDPVGH
jgi:ferredoxin